MGNVKLLTEYWCVPLLFCQSKGLFGHIFSSTFHLPCTRGKRKTCCQFHDSKSYKHQINSQGPNMYKLKKRSLEEVKIVHFQQ